MNEMKLFKRIKNFPKRIKAAFALNDALNLQLAGKDKEALSLLDKHSEILNESFTYHLNRGRILFGGYQDYEKAIGAFSRGISLIDSKRKIKPNDREYLLAWAKYMIAWGYNELNKKDTAEHWRSESEKHRFDIDRVWHVTKSEFPMERHVDYR